MQRTQARRRHQGFTLIELLVVLVILGLLASVAGPKVISYLGGAKSDTAKLQI
ncbi:MAG: prepilin-type N-terminal cleavage/methylation domain-containing protein, partial [Polaromonas sp.]